MTFQKGHKIRQKKASERTNDHLHLRCRTEDKRLFAKAAAIRAKRDLRIDDNVSNWVLDVLRTEANWEIEQAQQAKTPAAK